MGSAAATCYHMLLQGYECLYEREWGVSGVIVDASHLCYQGCSAMSIWRNEKSQNKGFK